MSILFWILEEYR